MPQIRFSKLALLAAIAATLCACAAKPAAESQSGKDQSGKDETAIRQLLANTERRINADDLSFVDAFAKDAVIIAPSAPDISGYDAIRAMYDGVMKQASMTVHFSTEEIVPAGDLAYEHGTYTFRMVDRKTGKVLQDVTNKHVHILKRQPDGSWKTWRMMVNSADAPPAAKDR
ncbi:MAG TPA: nuclear transport factor 2 family protein [Bryobacteraceae bacterium]|jgi:uncharacterized protein (TIGR02246 family)